MTNFNLEQAAREADRIADARLAAGAPPGHRGGSGAGTAEAG
jgi:hypothetical protein